MIKQICESRRSRNNPKINPPVKSNLLHWSNLPSTRSIQAEDQIARAVVVVSKPNDRTRAMVAEDIQMRIIGYMAAEHIIIPKVVCVDVLAKTTPGVRYRCGAISINQDTRLDMGRVVATGSEITLNYDRDTLTQYFKPVSLAGDVVFRNFY